jgi:hypothetical protein
LQPIAVHGAACAGAAALVCRALSGHHALAVVAAWWFSVLLCFAMLRVTGLDVHEVSAECVTLIAEADCPSVLCCLVDS